MRAAWGPCIWPGRAVGVPSRSRSHGPEPASDAHFRVRFRAEVTAARAVGGFHTAPVVDAGPGADSPRLATAYVPGPKLADRIRFQRPMEQEELARLGAALAEAPAAIHDCGLVHRELKPGNIVMAADGPRVLDFGSGRAVESARLTATEHAFRTPGFSFPSRRRAPKSRSRPTCSDWVRS